MPLWTIARLTLREVARRRLVVAVFILTAVVLGATAWFFWKAPSFACSNCSTAELYAGVSVLLILVMYMFSFVIALGAVFLAAPIISGDVESGVAQAMLPRPIRRSDYVLGKWLGLAGMLVLYTVVACGLELAIVQLTTGYAPPHGARTVAYLCGEAIVVLTVALLGSTRMAAMTVGITVAALYGLTWILGILGAVGSALGKPAMTHIGTVSSLILPSDALWRGAIYNLEPAAILAMLTSGPQGAAAANSVFAVAAPPTSAFIVWVALWLVAMLALCVYSFERREL